MIVYAYIANFPSFKYAETFAEYYTVIKKITDRKILTINSEE